MASESITEVTLDPVLTYVIFSLDNSPAENIGRVCSEFYSLEELLRAKEILWKVGDKDALPQYIRRRDSPSRSEIDATVEDIINGMQILDSAGKIPNIAVGPAGLNRIPKSKPAETCTISICERMTELEEKMKQLERTVLQSGMNKCRSYASVASSSTTGSIGHPATTERRDRDVSEVAAEPPTENNTTRRVQQPRTRRTEDTTADKEEFKLVQRRGRARKHHVQGTSKNTTNDANLKGAPEPSRDIFVYRVVKETAPSQIEKYLSQSSVKVRSIEKISKPEAKFDSFRVEVTASDLNKVMVAEFWPAGIFVRKFYRKNGSY